MNASEIREARRAKTLLRSGDRTGALKALDRLTQQRVPHTLRDQLMFGFVSVHCETLAVVGMPVRECVARQARTDAQRTTQASRGQGTDYPHCDSRKCEQGRAIREAVDPSSSVTWKGAGPGGRFERGRANTITIKRSDIVNEEISKLDGVAEAIHRAGRKALRQIEQKAKTQQT